MVINESEGFTLRKEVMRKGKKVVKWVDMLKGWPTYFVIRTSPSPQMAGISMPWLKSTTPPTPSAPETASPPENKLLPRTAKAFNPVAPTRSRSSALSFQANT